MQAHVNHDDGFDCLSIFDYVEFQFDGSIHGAGVLLSISSFNIENLSQMDIHVEWLRPIIDNLASKLNLAKSQTDYDAKDFNHVTGSYQGKEKDNDTKNDSN